MSNPRVVHLAPPCWHLWHQNLMYDFVAENTSENEHMQLVFNKMYHMILM